MKRYQIRQLLPNIDPALLDYQEWVNVGFVMRDEGMTAADWQVWSATDARHKTGECLKKWRSFGSNQNGVTVGTLVEYARRQGWTPPGQVGQALDWSAQIRDDKVVVDANWLEARTIHEPDSESWDQKAEIIRYLKAVFDSSDIVGYVTQVYDNGERKSPTKGAYDRTAGELISALHRTNDIEDVIGTVKPDVGAWVRFNPLDGHGVANANVTEFRYALVESDSMDLEKQYAMLCELNLPIRILVSSGGKSLHAIVRIDAGSMEEYRKRVDYLYTICKKNGMEIDQANRNPSRLSRLPGVYRNGRKQFIIAENLGAKTFTDWQEWIEAANDELPDFEAIEDVAEDLPELDPPLIDGILRQGHKMLLAGPSKAGKSFAMIQLAVAIAQGRDWFGFRCTQGKVLYINLELRDNSCKHRILDVCRAMGGGTNLHGNLVIWNLRGRGEALDKLAPKLIRRAMREHFMAIIIDPIYKVLTGDENNAEQMSRFCGYFDRIGTELGTAVIYCHHHSKGAQGGKKSMDRASGSGVFARDPDAQLDMIELELSESVQKHVRDQAAMAAIRQTLDKYYPKWQEVVPLDDQLGRLRLQVAAAQILDKGAGAHYEEMLQSIREAEKNAQSKTAWRIEATLREFAKPPALNVWFDYPVHRIDDSGVLADMNAEQALPPWKKGAQRSQKKRTAKKESKTEEFIKAVESAAMGEAPTLKEVAEFMNAAENSARRWMKDAGFKIDKNTGKIVKAEPVQE